MRSTCRARDRTVTLSPSAADAVAASLELKRSLIAQEIPIYGVTTGFGDSAHRQISPAKTAELQQNLLRFMGCGTGPLAPPEVVRVTMLLRANCLAKGNSGVRVELVQRLLDLLNNDVVPQIPERGSCGASGDLVAAFLRGPDDRRRRRGSPSTGRRATPARCWLNSAWSRSRSRPRKGWR